MRAHSLEVDLDSMLTRYGHANRQYHIHVPFAKNSPSHSLGLLCAGKRSYRSHGYVSHVLNYNLNLVPWGLSFF